MAQTEPLADEAALLRTAADLLYPQDAPRAVAWPTPQVLGLIRSRLRGLADHFEADESAGEGVTTRKLDGACVMFDGGRP